MSNGTTKCKMHGNCNLGKEAKDCTTACENYNPKNPNETMEITEEMMEQEKKSKNPNDVNLKISKMERFDTKHEFVVLKKHVFEFQSISPKKIILKYKRKLNKTDQLADGVYVFTDKDNELLIPHAVFLKFDRDAKDAREKKKDENELSS